MFINHTKPGVFTFKYRAYHEIRHYTGVAEDPSNVDRLRVMRTTEALLV